MCATVEQFVNNYMEHDPDYIIDILNIETEDILDRFQDKIADYLEKEDQIDDEGC